MFPVGLGYLEGQYCPVNLGYLGYLGRPEAPEDLRTLEGLEYLGCLEFPESLAGLGYPVVRHRPEYQDHPGFPESPEAR